MFAQQGSVVSMSKISLAVAALFAVLATSTAFAHAKLLSSTPADHEKLNASPAQMVLNFSEEGEMGPIKLMLGTTEIPVALDWSGTARKSFLIKLPHLAAGDYTLQWSMMSTDDGHVTRGSFGFTVAH